MQKITFKRLLQFLQKLKTISLKIFSLKVLGIVILVIGIPVTLYLSLHRQIFQGHAAKSAQLLQTESLARTSGAVLGQLQTNLSAATTTQEKQAITQTLTTTAKQHYQYMQQLIKNNDVDGFINSAVSKSIYNSMPEEAKPYVEETATRHGLFEIVHGDGINGEEGSFMAFQTDDKKQYVLRFADSTPYLTSGTTVNAIDGVKLGSVIALRNSSALQKLSSSQVKAVYGSPTVAIVLVNFKSNSGNKPVTKEAVRSNYFDSTSPFTVNGFLATTSYGKVHLIGKNNVSGDVFDWVSIDGDPNSCDFQDTSYGPFGDKGWLVNASIGVLQKYGVDLNSYDHVVFAIVKTSCSWGGLSLNNHVSIINGFDGFPTEWVYLNTHEMGHNFGLYHAGGEVCTEGGNLVPISSTCKTIDSKSQYFDLYDVMGGLSSSNVPLITYQYNNYQKRELGWITDSNMRTVEKPGGTFALYPIESNNNIVGIRIPRRDQSGKFLNYFLLEYRKPKPLDNFGLYISPTNETLTDSGIVIRLANDYGKPIECPGGYPYVCDDTLLVSTNPTANDYSLLEIGQKFYDPVSQITISVTYSPTDQCAYDDCKEVSISFGGPPTPTSAPFSNTCTSVKGQYCAPGREGCSSGYQEVSGKCDLYNRNVCCAPTTPTPTPPSTKCSDQANGTASCYKYECPLNLTQIFGNCSPAADEVCCANSSTQGNPSFPTPTPKSDNRASCSYPNYCTGGGSFNHCDGTIDNVHYKCSSGSCCKPKPTPTKTPTPTPFKNTCTSVKGHYCAPGREGCSSGYQEVSGKCDLYNRNVCCAPAPKLTPTPLPIFSNSSYCTDRGGTCSRKLKPCGSGTQALDGYFYDCGDLSVCCVANPCANANCGTGGYCGNSCGLTANPNIRYYCTGTCRQGKGTCTTVWTKTSTLQCTNSCKINSSGPDYCQ